jgi:2-methylcitrate dehydratase PrpD
MPISLELTLVEAARRAYRQPDPALFRIAKRHLIDCAAVALAALPVDAVKRLDGALPTSGGANAARLIGSGRPVAPRDAALLAGMAGHFHDYDDDDPALCVGHPTVPVFAALAAVAEGVGATMRDALAAYAAGVETTMRIGAIVNPRHYDAGFHATATLGVFGATMTAALLTGADDEQIVNALGLAASVSSGLKGNFGSDGKPFQVGAAAANGVLAAELGRRGLRAAPGALFGPAGFCTTHGGGDAHAVVMRFGEPWGLVDPGLNLKIYPCCSSTHTAADALFELMREGAIPSDDIDSIDAWIGPDVSAILIYDVPANPLQGKFSLRYCLAAAAALGTLDLAAFEPEAFTAPAVRSMLERVHVHVDPSLPRIPTGVTHASRVRVRRGDGREATRQIADPLGSARRPAPESMLREKFVRCAMLSLDAAHAARAFDEAMNLPNDAMFAHWLDLMRVESRT